MTDPGERLRSSLAADQVVGEIEQRLVGEGSSWAEVSEHGRQSRAGC